MSKKETTAIPFIAAVDTVKAWIMSSTTAENFLLCEQAVEWAIEERYIIDTIRKVEIENLRILIDELKHKHGLIF